jgi:hypothetical protein
VFSGFQSNGFQSPGFQIVRAAQNNYLGGDPTRYAWDKPEKIRKLETASQYINRLVDSLLKTENSEPVKEVAAKLNALALPEVQIPELTISYERLLEIQQIILNQLRREEEEEFIFLAMAATL